MSLVSYRKAASALVVLGVVGATAVGPAYAAPPKPGASASADAGDGEHWSPISIAAAGECTFPAADIPSKPWALQRVLLDELWKSGSGFVAGTGNKKSVVVAVIDTGVDNLNPQLNGDKVIDGGSTLVDKQTGKKADGTGITDTVGHGTKVAGIIAAKPLPGRTGFVGIAKDARILAIRQNDAEGNGDVYKLIDAIDQAVGTTDVGVINISQDVRVAEGEPMPWLGALKASLKKAEDKNIVVVASSGNDGHEGETYPAAIGTVLAVGASDRNNERAPFSQYGDFVGVAAPGVDMVSTVPKGGQCVDNGTSFSAPYVSGVAAVLKGMHPTWTAAQVRTRIEQTAQRTEPGANKFIGWGVIDPVKAVQAGDDQVSSSPTPDAKLKLDTVPIVAQPAGLAETQADRDRRSGTFVLCAGGLVVAALAGGSVVVRDFRRRRES